MEEIFKNRLLFENNRPLFPYCFLEIFVWGQSRDGGIPSPPTRENPGIALKIHFRFFRHLTLLVITPIWPEKTNATYATYPVSIFS